MEVKVVFVFCAVAAFVQSTLSQCTSRAAIDASGYGAPYGWGGPGLASNIAGPAFGCNGLAATGLGFDGLAGGWAGPYAPAMEFTATSGGSLPVTSSSAIAPTGISVVSENAFEGVLSLAGELPFVGTTSMEGAIPSAGAGAINHACGNGVTAMISEAAIAPSAAYFPATPIAPAGAAFAPAASLLPAAGAFGANPLAGGFGLGGCNRDIIY